jgi:hypothetical protein
MKCSVTHLKAVAELVARRQENWISIVVTGSFILFTVSRPVLGTTHVLIQRLAGAIYPRVKPTRRETDHSLLPTADVPIVSHISLWYAN